MIAWKRKKHLYIADVLSSSTDNHSTMPQLNASHTSVPAAVGSRVGSINAVNHSKHSTNAVSPCSPYRENECSNTAASTLGGTALLPSKLGCKPSSELSPSTAPSAGDMPSASSQHFPKVSSCSAGDKKAEGNQSEESLTRTIPNTNVSPPPSVLSGCGLTVHNSPEEQNRDGTTGNYGFNSEHDSQSKPEGITALKAIHMKSSPQPQTQATTISNTLQCSDIPNRVPRTDIPDVAVGSGDDHQTGSNPVPQQSRESQVLQESTASRSIGSIVTVADYSTNVSKTKRNISPPTSQEKGQASIAISKYRMLESAGLGIVTSVSGDQVSLSGKKGLQGKNDEMTFMSEYEKYVSEGQGLCMTKPWKSLNSKALMDYPDIKAALRRRNMLYNEGGEEPGFPASESNYEPGVKTTVPTATTLKRMVEKRLVIQPGKPGANADSGENSTVNGNPLLNSHHMNESVIDPNSTGFTRALGLIHVSNLQHQNVHGQSMSFPQFTNSSPIDIAKSHMNRRELWEKQAKGNAGMCDPSKSSKDVTVLDMSTGVSAPHVQTDIKGRGRSRGSRTRGGGRRARGERRKGSNRSYASTVEKGNDQDYGGMESLNPLEIDDTCTQSKRRGSRTRIRGGGRGNRRRRGSLGQHTNRVVDIAGPRVKEGASSIGLDRGDLTSERPNAYVDLTDSHLHSAERPAKNVKESNGTFTLTHDGLVECNQDARSSSVGAEIPRTTAGLTAHSTLKSLINQPTLQPIRPCSREITAHLLGTERSVDAQPVTQNVNQYHIHQRRRASPSDNHSFNQSSAQHMTVCQASTTLPTLANVLVSDRSQYEAEAVDLQVQSTPDLSSVLSNIRQVSSLQSTRGRLGQYLSNRKTGESTVSVFNPLQSNVIDLTEDIATPATTADDVMIPSQASVRVLQEPLRRRSWPDMPSAIPVPVCLMSKDTALTESSSIEKETPLLQSPVLLPKDMFSPTINHSPVLRPPRARSTAAMQSPTVVRLLNRAPGNVSSIRAPPTHLSPAHQARPKETLRLTRMLTPPAAHTPRNPSDILIEPAPPDISPIHVEIIHQRNKANLPSTPSVKPGNASILNTVSTSVSSDNSKLCPHGHKCMCVRSNSSSPDVQIIEGPLPSTSSSTQHHPQAVSTPDQSEILQASNLTVQRKSDIHSKPASITHESMHKRYFGTVPKDKCMTTCAHHIFDSHTHGIGFPHCAHATACPRVTLQQKCCQHLTGVPPPAHAKVPIEILQATPLDLTAVPPPVIESGLDLCIQDKGIPRPLDKKQSEPETSEVVKLSSGSLCGSQAPPISASTLSFQHANYSTGSLESVNRKDAGTLTVNHTAPFSVNNTVFQTSTIPTQLKPKEGDKSQLHSSDHFQKPAVVEQSSEKDKEVAAPKDHEKRHAQQKEPEGTGQEKPVYDLKKKSNIVQEEEQDKPKQKKSTKVNISKKAKDLAKLAEREEQIKGKRKVFRKKNRQMPETDANSNSVTPIETTQETSLSLADVTDSSTLVNDTTGHETDGNTVISKTTAAGTAAFTGEPVSHRQEGSLDNSRKKRNNVVKAQKTTSNSSKPKRKNKKSVSLHLDTNSDLTELPQTSRPKRAAVTSGGYKKECACSACINYDMPKRRRSKESASGNSTPSTPSTPPVQQITPLTSNNCEPESAETNLPEINKQSPAAHGVLNKSASLSSEQQSSEPLLEHSLEAVDRVLIPKELACDTQTMGRKSLSIRLKDISKCTLPGPKDIDEERLLDMKKAQPESVIPDRKVSSRSLDTVGSDTIDKALISEIQSSQAQVEVAGMAVPSAQTKYLSEGDSEAKSASFSEKESQQKTSGVEIMAGSGVQTENLPKKSPETETQCIDSDKNEVQKSTSDIAVEGMAGPGVQTENLPKKSPETQCIDSDKNEVQKSTSDVADEAMVGPGVQTENLTKKDPETHCINSDKYEVQPSTSDVAVDAMTGPSVQTEDLPIESPETLCIRSENSEVQQRNSGGNVEGIAGTSVQNEHVSKEGSEARCITSDINEDQQGTSDAASEGMTGPSVPAEHLSKEITETKAIIFDKNEVQQGTADVTNCSTELGLVISSVVGGFTEGPSNDEAPTESNELCAEISDSGHFSLSDSENILRLPVSESESVASNLGCAEETSENVLGTVTVKHDEDERSYEVEKHQDIITIKTEVNDQIPEESTGQSENNQNVGYSNSDTDSDLPSFYSYLSAGSTLRSTNSKASDIQKEGQMTLADNGTRTQTGRHARRKGKKGKQKHLTRRKRNNTAKKVVPPPIIYEDIDELPDIKHHTLIQDYSTMEHQTVIGNKEVIDVQQRREQVPDFSDIVIKQEPVDDTSVYLPLIKECSIVLQNIQTGEPQLQKLSSKQSQSRKRKPGSSAKANAKPKYHRTGKRINKASSEKSHSVKDGIEAGSACAMKTTDQIIKSEPSYDEASTSAYSDGGETALESEDDECNLKVLQNSIVHSSKPEAQASNISENIVLAHQSYLTDEQESSNQVHLSDQHSPEAKVDIRYPLVGNNQGIVSEAFNDESQKASKFNENSQDTYQTGDVEANNLTNMSHQQKSMSDQQSNAPDHQIRETVGQDNRLEQTAALDDTSDKVEDHLNNRESPEVDALVSGQQVPNNVQIDDCQSDENAKLLADQLKKQESPEVAASVSGQLAPNNVQTDDCQSDEKAELSGDQLNNWESLEVAVSLSGQQVPNNVQTDNCQSDEKAEPSGDQLNNQKSSEVAVSLSGQQVPNNVQTDNCQSDEKAEPSGDQLNNQESSEVAVSLSGLQVPNSVQTDDCQFDKNTELSGDQLNNQESSEVAASPGGQQVPNNVRTNNCQFDENKEPSADHLNNQESPEVALSGQGVPNDEQTTDFQFEEKKEFSADQQNNQEYPELTSYLSGEVSNNIQTNDCQSGENEKPSVTEVEPTEEIKTIPDSSDSGSVTVPKAKLIDPIIIVDHTKSGESGLQNHITNLVDVCEDLSNPERHEDKELTNAQDSPSRQVKNIASLSSEPKPRKQNSKCKRQRRQTPTCLTNAGGISKNRRTRKTVIKEVLPELPDILKDGTEAGSLLAMKATDYVIKSQPPCNKIANNGTKTTAKKRSCGKQKILKPKGSEDVCANVPKDQGKTGNRFQDDVEELHLPEHIYLTTDIRTCDHDTVNPFEESNGKTGHPCTHSKEVQTRSCNAESIGEEQGVTNILESADAGKKVKMVKSKRGRQKKGNKPVALKKTAEGQRELESKTVCEELIKRKDDGVQGQGAGQDGDTSLEVSGKQMHALNQVKPAGNVLHSDSAIVDSTKQQDVLVSAPVSVFEQQKEAVTQAESQNSLSIRNLVETASERIQKGNKKVVPANSRSKRAAKNCSGGKRKAHRSQELKSKLVSEKVIDNQDDPVNEIQEGADTYLALDNLVADHGAVKAFAEAEKQGEISNRVEHAHNEVNLSSESIISTTQDHTFPSVMAVSPEQPLKVANARRSKGIKSLKTTIAPAKRVAKAAINKPHKRPNEKDKRLTPEGVEAKSLCRIACENSDDTDSKNQAEPLMESVSSEHNQLTTDYSVLPKNKGTKTTLKKRSGGKRKIITPNGIEFEKVSEMPKKKYDDACTENQDRGVSASLCTGHESVTTGPVPIGHNAEKYVNEAGMQGTKSHQLKPLNNELDVGQGLTEATSQEVTVVNPTSSGCEQQLKVTNPPIRKLLETGLKGFKTYKVTKKSAKKLIGEKRKILTLGGSETIHDRLIKKLKVEDTAVESKIKKRIEGVKACFVRLKRLDDKIIGSASNGSINYKLLSTVSTKPPSLKWPEQKHEENMIETQGLNNSMPEPTHSPASSIDHAPPDLTFEEECAVEIDSLNIDVPDNIHSPDRSFAEVTPNDHESILEMLQRQVLENHSILGQDDGENSLVRDRAAPSEDDSMMPPLSPKAKKVQRQTDKQSPLWGYLAEVGYRKRKL